MGKLHFGGQLTLPFVATILKPDFHLKTHKDVQSISPIVVPVVVAAVVVVMVLVGVLWYQLMQYLSNTCIIYPK